MTLHEAIIKVLNEAGRPLPVKDIAKLINQQNLYQRKDGNPIPVSQIYARVKNYPSLFYQDKGIINLVSSSIPERKKPSNTSTDVYNDLYYFTKEKDSNKDSKIFIEFKSSNDISNKNNIQDTLSSLTEGKLQEFRKNLMLHIKKEIEKDGQKTIGVLNKKGLKIAVAIAAIYEETSKSSRSFRNEIAHHKGLERLEFYSDNPDINKLDNRLIALLELYLSTFKVFKGKDLTQFYIDLIEEWGKTWELSTPLWISKLMARLADPKVNDKVLDPAAGIGRSLLEIIELNPFAEIFGCEIDPDAHKLAQAVLKLEKVAYSNIILGDSLEKSPGSFLGTIQDHNQKLFDVVISDPPKGRIKHLNNKGLLNTYDDSSELFLAKMISCTRIGGSIACVLTDSVLSNESSRKNRVELLKHAWIKAVVSLPLSAFDPFSGTKNSLILLTRKNQDETNEPFPVRFIDSEEIIKVIKDSFQGIDNEDLNSELIERINDIINGTSGQVPSKIYKEISQHDLLGASSFSVKYHLSESWETIKFLQETGEKLLPLKEFLTEPKTSRYSKELFEDIYIIQPKDLFSNAKLSSLINYADRQGAKEPDSMIRVLEEPVILVNRRVNYFAPTYIEIVNKKVAITTNTFAFGWDKSLVLPEYVVAQLKTDLVKQQLEAMAVGSVLRYIQKKDILSIKIPVPSISEQNEIISKIRQSESEKSGIVKFISQINLVETRDQLKKELERYARENHFPNGNPRFQTEMDFKEFPFSQEEINNNKWFKMSKDKHFAYLLMISNKQIFGVLILENTDNVMPESYNEINIYAGFLYKLTRHILSSTASSNLAKFAHTTKNFLLNLHEPLKAIANTQNQELKKLLSENYIDDEETIDIMIKSGNGKKEDFLAFNVLQDALRRISLYTSFFKKISEIYYQISKNEFESINIIDIIKEADIDNVVEINVEKQNIQVFGKQKSILLAFTDLIQNACKYSPDRKCKIQIIEEAYHVEIIISNKIKEQFLMDQEIYESLGKDWVTRDTGTGTGSGFFSAKQSIEDSGGELQKAPYEEYVSNKVFKITIKLKTNQI